MTSSKPHCRWALVGLSAIAVKFVKDLLLVQDGGISAVTHEVVALSTTGTKERAVEWLSELKVPEVENVAIFTSYRELLELGDFDVLYISTPLGAHYSNTWDAISHGRNVLLEKPAVINREQYERLATYAKEKNVVLMEAIWTRYFPAARKFGEEVVPRLGPIRRIFADFSLPLLDDPYLPASSRFLDWSTGAGSLMDLGVYPLTWVDMALNPLPVHEPLQSSSLALSTQLPEAVSVEVLHANTIFHETHTGPIDDISTIILKRAEPPCTAIVTATLSVPGSAVPHHDDRLLVKKNTPSIRVQGTKAEASIEFPPIRPEIINLMHYGSDRVDKDGRELYESLTEPVYGWGLWYQADVIGELVWRRKYTKIDSQEITRGVVIGEQGTLRVLGWMDKARSLAGIKFSSQLEKPW